MNSQMPIQECFLCFPDQSLVFDSGKDGLALSGLGPLVDGYSVVATLQHADSLADLETTIVRRYLDYTEYLRKAFASQYGTCLVAEHGNSPLCYFDWSRDKHCFHPHFLLFPGVPDVTREARKRISNEQSFPSLWQAISASKGEQEYLLLSPSPNKVTIFYPDSMLPSQFSRTLVGAALGKLHLASWQKHPNKSDAQSNAISSKILLTEFYDK